MSMRSIWKMLHLLYNNRRPELTGAELLDANVDCTWDTIDPLFRDEVVRRDPARDTYSLTAPARRILESCVVANRRWPGKDMRVDAPRAFVIMPFSAPWSNDVYSQMIEPAVKDAGLDCRRGDHPVRVGDLTGTIWDELLLAGLVIAEVSEPNPNVFYEVGLAHALGKDTFLLKQAGVKLSADFGGTHYYEYDLKELSNGRDHLSKEVAKWASEVHAAQVGRLLGT
jgi:hypothetical protein